MLSRIAYVTDSTCTQRFKCKEFMVVALTFSVMTFRFIVCIETGGSFPPEMDSFFFFLTSCQAAPVQPGPGANEVCLFSFIYLYIIDWFAEDGREEFGRARCVDKEIPGSVIIDIIPHTISTNDRPGIKSCSRMSLLKKTCCLASNVFKTWKYLSNRFGMVYIKRAISR